MVTSRLDKNMARECVVVKETTTKSDRVGEGNRERERERERDALTSQKEPLIKLSVVCCHGPPLPAV